MIFFRQILYLSVHLLFCLHLCTIYTCKNRRHTSFIFWSFLLGISGIKRTYLIFRTADKKTYEIVEGLVTGIDGKNPFARLRKIRVSDPAGRQSELLLDKNVKVLEGKRYRFYFGINEKKLVGIRRVDAALNNGTFLGNEEI